MRKKACGKGALRLLDLPEKISASIEKKGLYLQEDVRRDEENDNLKFSAALALLLVLALITLLKLLLLEGKEVSSLNKIAPLYYFSLL